ncbi:GAF and ANTAR domain-containing protein [Arthrobacter sp. N1]|uniref:GAF and ANTAR domain-containing protein n=1 Tax=Arthrobacter sp. N1 TaxID=619291 RepID=UPI003BAFD8EB
MTPNGTDDSSAVEQSVDGDLLDFVTGTEDVHEFLQEIAARAAHRLTTPDHQVMCAVSLLRRRRPMTVAWSNEDARRLDDEQNRVAEGPCITAARSLETVYVPDTLQDDRWPDYLPTASGQGVRSILGTPFHLADEADAGLNFYSSSPDAFPAASIGVAHEFVRETSNALRLAVRLAVLASERDDLDAALRSRSTINTAVGILMAQNHCSQKEALTFLERASSVRNLKLRDVAAAVVASAGGTAGPPPAP